MVPAVAKSADAVLPLCTLPEADTVATTAPRLTGTARPAAVLVVEVFCDAVTIWYAQPTPTSATTPRAMLSAIVDRSARAGGSPNRMPACLWSALGATRRLAQSNLGVGLVLAECRSGGQQHPEPGTRPGLGPQLASTAVRLHDGGHDG